MTYKRGQTYIQIKTSLETNTNVSTYIEQTIQSDIWLTIIGYRISKFCYKEKLLN